MNMANKKIPKNSISELKSTKKASYKVAYRIAQCKKPHTIAEELILSGALDMVSAMTDETNAVKLKAVPMSNDRPYMEHFK